MIFETSLKLHEPIDSRNFETIFRKRESLITLAFMQLLVLILPSVLKDLECFATSTLNNEMITDVQNSSYGHFAYSLVPGGLGELPYKKDKVSSCLLGIKSSFGLKRSTAGAFVVGFSRVESHLVESSTRWYWLIHGHVPMAKF